jgi:hypothetical protein
MAAVWLHRQCSFICFSSTKPQLNLSALLTKSHAHTHLSAWMAASSSCDQHPVIFPAYMCGGTGKWCRATQCAPPHIGTVCTATRKKRMQEVWWLEQLF